jgi:3-oxoacyl-[acyl-carrier protein] reductase
LRQLDGKRAIVTGASRGIGFATAARLVSDGCSVVLNDIAPDRLSLACDKLSTVGPVSGIPGDVTNPTVCQRLVDHLVDWKGGIDVVVNNAGMVRFGHFLNFPVEDWDRTIAVDLKAVFLLSQCAARVMAEARSGVILATASTNGHVAEPYTAAYNAAKAGVVLLVKSMAVDLAPYGIRANCVSPGHVGPTALATEGGASEVFTEGLEQAIPLGRIGHVEEIAGVFAFLASDRATFITGQSIVVDGGQLSIQFGSEPVRAPD